MYLVQAMSEINMKCLQREKYNRIDSSYILLYFNDDDLFICCPENTSSKIISHSNKTKYKNMCKDWRLPIIHHLNVRKCRECQKWYINYIVAIHQIFIRRSSDYDVVLQIPTKQILLSGYVPPFWFNEFNWS